MQPPNCAEFSRFVFAFLLEQLLEVRKTARPYSGRPPTFYEAGVRPYSRLEALGRALGSDFTLAKHRGFFHLPMTNRGNFSLPYMLVETITVNRKRHNKSTAELSNRLCNVYISVATISQKSRNLSRKKSSSRVGGREKCSQKFSKI